MTEDRNLQVRQRVFRFIVLTLFLILIGNLFYMMVPRHGFYQEQALENRQVRFNVTAPRGRITDRYGTILADNLYIADITLPRTVLVGSQPDSTLKRLITWFDLPEEETLDRLSQQKEKGRRRLVLVPNASMPRISAVQERSRQLPGVRVESRPRRRYLHGTLLAHLVGYVGEVGLADLDTTDGRDYRLGDLIGKQGVEAALEEHLRGNDGLKLEEVNAANRVVGRRTIWLEEIQAGADVALTISLPLQEQMDLALGEGIGCGVAMSVRTGEVLAACSKPTFDSNIMTVSISSSQWNTMINDPSKPFFNRIVQATYPPGSIYKSVTSLAGLSLGVIDTNTVLEPCLGGMQFGNRFFRCWKRGGHGSMDHTDAMVNSCDTYYYQLGLRMDIDQLAGAARAFGLGQTCSDIFPSESAGNIPNTVWYDERFGPGGWTRGVLLNNSIGQGEILVTPLQMAMMTARIASSGKTPNPNFVLTPTGEVQEPPKLPFNEKHLQWCRESMWQVVGRGTGKAAQQDSFSVAGKTGTAQNSHGEDHAWFVCFAPVENPEVAVAILLENAGHGGSEAAPIAGEWLRAWFASEDRDRLMNNTGQDSPKVREAS
jgi:penicillin-binding protein 2